MDLALPLLGLPLLVDVALLIRHRRFADHPAERDPLIVARELILAKMPLVAEVAPIVWTGNPVR
ncbi:hypothetical protein [Aromatoleum aromaticum]|uniref:hypothetical protein n=1 Tax=Aromatoleum aromaticum TaxID=551760 RepID=UPI001459CF37|nr:hypothetical protein [Aromatoleum aromaticum]NMG56747.1 hypothetical protein [Aromatoleum aromaticum]